MRKGLVILVFVIFLLPLISADTVRVFNQETNEWIEEDDFLIPLPVVSEQISVSKAKATISLGGKRVQAASNEEREFELENSELIPWGVERVNAPFVWHVSKGEGVKVAIIDTGIDGNHSDLTVAGGWNVIDDNDDLSDPVGHGTMVAGVIAARENELGIIGTAPEVELYVVKALDEDGGLLSDIIDAVNWSIANDMDVISMSFGSSVDSLAFELKLAEAFNEGIVLIASAGNGDDVLYPAKYPQVISAGNLDIDNEVPSGASGSTLELAAPGTLVLTTFPDDLYVLVSGTSFSAPHIAGIVAMIKQNDSSLSVNEIRDKLHSDALDLGDEGRDDVYGFGLARIIFNGNDKVIGERLDTLESWREVISLAVLDILDSITSLIESNNDHEERIQSLESKNFSVVNGSSELFQYLSSRERKNVACGFAEDNRLERIEDFGWGCDLTYSNTSRGERVRCRCRRL